MKNGSNMDSDLQPMMILTIDIGNGQVDKLQLFDLNNIDKETYDAIRSHGFFNNARTSLQREITNGYKTNTTVRTLGAGITGRQFISTPEAGFYQALSPEEKAAFKALPQAEKENIMQIYQQYKQAV